MTRPKEFKCIQFGLLNHSLLLPFSFPFHACSTSHMSLVVIHNADLSKMNE